MSRRTPTDPSDELYHTPLAEFVHARNALAARLAKSGRPADAKRMRALAKPKATVWGVNRLAREAPKLIQRVLKAFDALKHAQLRRADQFGAASEELRVAVDAAVDHAQSLLAAEGSTVSLDARRRIDATLRGAAAGARDALVRGTLTQELSAPGFELFAGARPASRPLRAVRGSASAARGPREPADATRAAHGSSSAARAMTPSTRAEAAPDRAEMLRRRAAQLEDEAAAREREATAAAAALMQARQRMRELEQRARAAQRAATKSRRTAARARSHAQRRSRTRSS